jgi:uncharacterized protein
MTDSSDTLPVPRKKATGYLFLPHSLSRGTFLKWLRRTHAWFGLWGAALGLLFGVSGILLNHHNVLKIHAVKQEKTEIQLSLPTPPPATAKAMAIWLGQALKIEARHAKIQQETPKTVIWNNQPFQQPALWQITIRNPKRMVQAEYWQGNAFVSVKQAEGNFFAVLIGLHKGTGMGIGWVLLADTLAGGLIVLSLTGTLLWTGLHGNRLGAAGLGFGSLLLILFFALQAIGV